MAQQIADVHVQSTVPLPTPRELEAELPLSDEVQASVLSGRRAVEDILDGRDSRLLVIAGPCSIHDEQAALEYAERLAPIAEELSDRVLIAMRVYFEKPRTTVGWKGMIYDPDLDGSFDIASGLRRARQLLITIAGMGLPTATEFLDPITPQYLADLISWTAIGARTTESQTHRQMASGLSMPVGFKNSTDGNSQIAVDAMLSSREPHAFLGIDGDGRTCTVLTNGNPHGHIVLRGGNAGPNYEARFVHEVYERLEAGGLRRQVLVDCSHANSGKDHARQSIAFRDLLAQRAGGDPGIVGLMLESHLFEGKQSLGDDPADLRYGVSITDACIGWDETVELLREAAAVIREPAAASA
ncbi:MAG: 3-deoxy-7-phosphoheptulonate synthase [Chloroflexota bacterium]|nr:3-deoxy-7-phosphoheptulonate synthase [Chloroflexota bacterium]MXZ63210.1 3-deoxy-7-phosphoheptulonate synthase [Chloroflexota bacterium]